MVSEPAQEKGIFGQNGLEAEWVSFEGGGPFMRALVARSIFVGYAGTADGIHAASRGVPVVMVADHFLGSFSYWVAGKSPIREPKDLKGARIGVSSLASSPHIMGEVAAKALGLERDVRFVAVGGHATRIAALRSGAIEGFITNFISVAEMAVKGEVREVVNISDHLPKPWVDNILVAHRTFVKEEPETARKAVRSSLQGVTAVVSDVAWTVAKLKELSGYSEATAREVHEDLRKRFTRDGRIDPKGLGNVVTFLVDKGLIARDKAPRPEEFFTNEYLP